MRSIITFQPSLESLASLLGILAMCKTCGVNAAALDWRLVKRQRHGGGNNNDDDDDDGDDDSDNPPGADPDGVCKSGVCIIVQNGTTRTTTAGVPAPTPPPGPGNGPPAAGPGPRPANPPGQSNNGGSGGGASSSNQGQNTPITTPGATASITSAAASSSNTAVIETVHPKKLSGGGIAGAVIGSVVIVGLAGMIIASYRRRARKAKKRPRGFVPTDFTSSTAPAAPGASATNNNNNQPPAFSDTDSSAAFAYHSDAYTHGTIGHHSGVPSSRSNTSTEMSQSSLSSPVLSSTIASRALAPVPPILPYHNLGSRPSSSMDDFGAMFGAQARQSQYSTYPSSGLDAAAGGPGGAPFTTTGSPVQRFASPAYVGPGAGTGPVESAPDPYHALQHPSEHMTTMSPGPPGAHNSLLSAAGIIGGMGAVVESPYHQNHPQHPSYPSYYTQTPSTPGPGVLHRDMTDYQKALEAGEKQGMDQGSLAVVGDGSGEPMMMTTTGGGVPVSLSPVHAPGTPVNGPGQDQHLLQYHAYSQNNAQDAPPPRYEGYQ